jgi:hypothetical protein
MSGYTEASESLLLEYIKCLKILKLSCDTDRTSDDFRGLSVGIGSVKTKIALIKEAMDIGPSLKCILDTMVVEITCFFHMF